VPVAHTARTVSSPKRFNAVDSHAVMPIASVGPEGTQLSYIDSGPPSHKSLYTTLVIIHGYCWNGGTFVI
jgi:hypothetical protein